MRSRPASDTTSSGLGNRTYITGFANAKRPAAEGIEISIVALIAAAIFSRARSLFPAAHACATEGIIAEAMAVAKAMGILNTVMD